MGLASRDDFDARKLELSLGNEARISRISAQLFQKELAKLETPQADAPKPTRPVPITPGVPPHLAHAIVASISAPGGRSIPPVTTPSATNGSGAVRRWNPPTFNQEALVAATAAAEQQNPKDITSSVFASSKTRARESATSAAVDLPQLDAQEPVAVTIPTILDESVSGLPNNNCSADHKKTIFNHPMSNVISKDQKSSLGDKIDQSLRELARSFVKVFKDTIQIGTGTIRQYLNDRAFIEIEVDKVVQLHQEIVEGDLYYVDGGATLIFKPTKGTTWKILFRLPVEAHKFSAAYVLWAGHAGRSLTEPVQKLIDLDDDINIMEPQPRYSSAIEVLKKPNHPNQELEEMVNKVICEDSILTLINSLNAEYGGSVLNHILKITETMIDNIVSPRVVSIMEELIGSWFNRSESFIFLSDDFKAAFVASISNRILLKLEASNKHAKDVFTTSNARNIDAQDGKSTPRTKVLSAAILDYKLNCVMAYGSVKQNIIVQGYCITLPPSSFH
jgi:hypothetical protein